MNHLFRWIHLSEDDYEMLDENGDGELVGDELLMEDNDDIDNPEEILDESEFTIWW